MSGGEASRPGPTISVVICTRNRADALERTLGSYDALWDDPRWTMVLVDDGSSDRTGCVIGRFVAARGDRVRTVRTQGVGLGAARNEGWRASTGDIVLFTDDDCYPDRGLLDAIRRRVSDTADAFVGGRLLPFAPEDGAVAVVTRNVALDLDRPQFVPAGLLPGANLAVKRAALEAVGGFDAEFGAGTAFAAEDVDLVARLLAAGFRGGYDPRLVVYHHHGRHDSTSQHALRRAYDHGRGAYYAKCLGNPILRPHYLRAWVRRAWRGSWAAAGRELVGAWKYWTRARSTA